MYVVGTPLAVAAERPCRTARLGQDTDHVTPLVAEPFVMVAVNCAVELGCIVAESGETVTEDRGWRARSGTTAEENRRS